MKAAIAALLAGSLLSWPCSGVATSGSVRLLRTASLVRQAPPSTVAAAVGANEQECFEVPSTVCLQDSAGKTFVHAKNHYPRDLQLWYQFDKQLPVDDSGNIRHLLDSNQALTPLLVGPGLLGRGASAAFDGHSMRTVTAPEAFESPSFTVALWVFLREDSVGSWRTLFCRGSRPEDLRTALLLAPHERRLHVRASRVESASGALEAVGLLPLRRWTHVAVVCTGGVMRLYINGVKDNEIILEEPVAADGDAPLYIGGDPWRAGTKAYLDDFRWYSREVGPDELRAMLYPSLTGILAPDTIFLGCTSCRFPEAVRACNAKHAHLCSLQGLYSGGYHTARAMGWLTSSAEVWYAEEKGADVFQPVSKLGICCTD